MGDALRAEQGMALFEKSVEAEVILDAAGAEAFKSATDGKIAAMEEQSKALAGKDNKKLRTELGKEISALRNCPKYVDACKVVKGGKPTHGNFCESPAGTPSTMAPATPPMAPTPLELMPALEAPVSLEPAAETSKADKKPKKVESAGLSREEKDELEKLREQIIHRKTQLKEQGMSGGQQNKDEDIVKWVTRMNALKEKENPGSTGKESKADKKTKKKGTLSVEEMQKLEQLKFELDEYTNRLKTEFGYTKKDIAKDPDWMEMSAQLKLLEGRS